MADRFVEVTLEEMRRALKRRFRVYRPRESVVTYKGKSMYVFDLKIDDYVAIRVWSSITPRGDVGKGVGESSIKVQMVSLRKGSPLQSKKNRAAIVQRSTNWADNLEKRINKVLLTFNDSADFWIGLAMRRDGISPDPKPEPESVTEARPPEGDEPQKPRYAGPPVSDKQIKFLVSLIIKARNGGVWESYAEEYGLPTGFITKGHLKEILSGGRDGSASKLITALIAATKGMGDRRYAETEEALGLNDPIVLSSGDIQHDLYGDAPD